MRCLKWNNMFPAKHKHTHSIWVQNWMLEDGTSAILCMKSGQNRYATCLNWRRVAWGSQTICPSTKNRLQVNICSRVVLAGDHHIHPWEIRLHSPTSPGGLNRMCNRIHRIQEAITLAIEWLDVIFISHYGWHDNSTPFPSFLFLLNEKTSNYNRGEPLQVLFRLGTRRYMRHARGRKSAIGTREYISTK